MDFGRSVELWGRHKKVAAGVSTYSKSPHRFPFGTYPVYIESGEGCKVYDMDGNEYIDWISGLGCIILGYRYPAVDRAVSEQLKKGIIFSLPSPLEAECAELLTGVIPCAEKVIFLKDGSDATSAAVRLARAFTGKEKVAYYKGSYHGWHDWFGISQPINLGVPKCLRDTIAHFETLLELINLLEQGNVGAVIMEPVIWEPIRNFLIDVEKVVHDSGAVLIFDEIVTIPRFALGGIQELYDIEPDIVCVGKGLANGMPFSAVVGREDILKLREDEEVFISGTNFGEALSLAAVIAAVNEIRDKDVPKHIWEAGYILKEEFNDLAKEVNLNARMQGLPCRMKFLFENNEQLSLFLQECVQRGVLFHPGVIYPNFSHDIDAIEKTLNACSESLSVLKKAVNKNNVREMLKGEVIREIKIRKD